MAPDAAATSLQLPAAKRPAAADADQALAQGDHQAGGGNGKQQQVECPRCGSGNTKFCYYNNYSTAQPRHFCRACRRYWTHGGSLRNVPVGGACRRRDASASGNANNKRRRASSDNSSSSAEPPSSAEVAYRPPDQLPTTALMFPFLSDGAFFLPPQQYDLGIGAAASPVTTFSWPLYDGGLAAATLWDDGTLSNTAGAATGAWGDEFTGLDLSWPPAAGN